MTAPAVAPAVAQLITWWQRQDDGNKLIFNQLYREMPDVVLRVLTQGQLEPDPAHTSIDDVVGPNADQMMSLPGVDVWEVTVTPPYPKANEQFTVQWSRQTTGPLPDHSDAVQIADLTGASVDERSVSIPAVADSGRSSQTMTFDGLPNGSYAVSVWANLEGNDGTGVPTAQGTRGWGGAQLFVGDTRESQIAQTMPAAGNAMSGVSDAQYAVSQIVAADQDQPLPPSPGFATGLTNAIDALLGVDSLGTGFQDELNRARRALESIPPWEHVREEGQLGIIAQRLQGMLSINAAESPGDLGFAIIGIVDDIYP